MPCIADLTPGTIYQGNGGDKWIVGDGIQSEKEMTVVLKKMEVIEKIEAVVAPAENEIIKEI